MKYRAVVFDLFGTLVYPYDSSRFAEVMRQMAAVVSVDYEVFQRYWSVDTWRKRAVGYFPTTESTIDFICKANGVSPSERQLSGAARMRHAFTKSCLRPRQDALATLQAIKERRLRLGLISDCTVEVPGLWLETPFAPLIDVPVFSCKAGTKKPDPQIYALACDQLACAPGECIYIADGYSQELQGATTVGMRAILLAPPGETVAEGVDWEGRTWQGERASSLWEAVFDVLDADEG